MAIVERNKRIDSLRVAAAFAVVMLHTAAGYLVKIHDSDSAAWWVANFYDASCRWSVPIFLLISGSLLLKSNESFSVFCRKRFSRIIIPLIFWSIFYLCIRLFVFRNIQFENVPSLLLQGTPYVHLWYLYMLLGLYLVFPIIRGFVKSLSRRSGIFVVIFLSLLSVVNLFLNELPDFFLIKFIPFLCYFVGGYFLKDITLKSKGVYYIVFLGLLVFLSAGGLMHFYGSKSFAMSYDYLNPLIILLSFLIFTLPKHKNAFRLHDLSISDSSFGIYLIHPFFLIPLGRLFSVNNAEYIFILIPLVSFSVFMVSWRSVVFMRRFAIGRSVLGG